ncbi:MAG: membrane protein insertion efficiency factor YidD [Candidatus Marinimicrobia bacterium]|nr:membrane protein insertion efficiency factor YidD [Candidatus Neomarinimicrobiota bacterium]
MNYFNLLLVSPLIFLIKIYQLLLSPFLGSNCRFIPTCSEYTKQSLLRYGLVKGSFLALRRLSKCHPCSKSHFNDPLN